MFSNLDRSGSIRSEPTMTPHQLIESLQEMLTASGLETDFEIYVVFSEEG
jgi:hypothetical protein